MERPAGIADQGNFGSGTFFVLQAKTTTFLERRPVPPCVLGVGARHREPAMHDLYAMHWNRSKEALVMEISKGIRTSPIIVMKKS